MVFYFIFLGILIILWLLFVYNLNVVILFSLDYLTIKIFKIPFIRLKKDKYKKFLSRFIPKSSLEVKEEIDLTSLIGFINFDVVEVKVDMNVYDYPKLIIFNSFLGIIETVFEKYLGSKIGKYTYLITKSETNNIRGIIKCNFNIGVVLLNYLIIKGRYKYAKTNQ